MATRLARPENNVDLKTGQGNVLSSVTVITKSGAGKYCQGCKAVSRRVRFVTWLQ